MEIVMHVSHPLIAALAGAALVALASPSARGQAFTYQAQLTENGQLANGFHDFQYTMYDAPSGGNQIGSSLFFQHVLVANGRFTEQLNFGQGLFDGAPRYLEITVIGPVVSPPSARAR
jgi:hypothetical protein